MHFEEGRASKEVEKQSGRQCLVWLNLKERRKQMRIVGNKAILRRWSLQTGSIAFLDYCKKSKFARKLCRLLWKKVDKTIGMLMGFLSIFRFSLLSSHCPLMLWLCFFTTKDVFLHRSTVVWNSTGCLVHKSTQGRLGFEEFIFLCIWENKLFHSLNVWFIEGLQLFYILQRKMFPTELRYQA